MRLDLQGCPAYAYTGGRRFDVALPCVAMIHGALNDHSVWALQSRYLAHHGFGVLAVDLPGHGRSAGPALASVEALAQWIVALLDALHVPRAALVGHSMGSLIALETAARLAERAACLAMVGTAYPMKVSPVLLDTATNAPDKAIEMVTSLSIASLAPKPSAPGPGTWLHGASRALQTRLQSLYAQAGHGNLFHHDFTLCDRYAGALQAAERVRCPVRFVLGAKDSMTAPKAGAELARALKADVVTIAKAGHSLMSEAPDAVLDALAEFVRG